MWTWCVFFFPLFCLPRRGGESEHVEDAPVRGYGCRHGQKLRHPGPHPGPEDVKDTSSTQPLINLSLSLYHKPNKIQKALTWFGFTAHFSWYRCRSKYPESERWTCRSCRSDQVQAQIFSTISRVPARHRHDSVSSGKDAALGLWVKQCVRLYNEPDSLRFKNTDLHLCLEKCQIIKQGPINMQNWKDLLRCVVTLHLLCNPAPLFSPCHMMHLHSLQHVSRLLIWIQITIFSA